MRYLRLFADKSGESHLAEVSSASTPLNYAPPAPALEMTDQNTASGSVMMRFHAGWDSELHPTASAKNQIDPSHLGYGNE